MRIVSALAILLFFTASRSALAQSTPVMLAANNDAAVSSHNPSSTMLLIGRVESPAGPLVGAIVSVNGKTYQKAVTNLDGEFHLAVPATTEPISITASYAGFRDVSATVQPGTTLASLRLTEAQKINVRRHLQLKAYIKGAHREARRESRRLHRG